MVTYMFTKAIIPDLLQRLEIVDHSFIVRRRIDSVRPESLIERAEEEDKLPIQQRSFHTINDTSTDGPEPSVGLNDVLACFDGDVIKAW